MDLEKEPFTEKQPEEPMQERGVHQSFKQEPEHKSHAEYERPYASEHPSFTQHSERKSFADEAYLPTRPDIHTLGVTSLICGVTSLIVPFFNVVLAILAIVFGNRGIKEANMLNQLSGKDTDGRTMAKVGFYLGIASLVITVLVILFWVFAVGLAVVGNM